MESYIPRHFDIPTKRYCQTLKLKNEPALIAEYERLHSAECSWKEIRDGIREVGILEMEIYRYENLLFMVVETPLDFDWDSAMARLATLPRQAEWENTVAAFQQCAANATSDEKWHGMKRIFYLYD